ncbi:MAG: ABC transporter permease subunit [Bdellovibrionota bacterium]
MRNILAIAARDIRSSFVTPIAYVVFAGFLLLSGFFFFTLLQQFNPMSEQAAMMRDMTPNLNEWVVGPYFQTMEVVLIFLVPLLTMRSIAEEKHNGTFEMLMTSPVSVGQIVLGKAFAVGFVSFVMLLLSFVFPAVLIAFADPEVPPILIGFLGLLLFTWAFAAIGLAVSAFTRSQTVAGVVSLVVLLIFYVIDAPTSQLGPEAGSFFKYLAPTSHIEMMLKGVLQGSDLVYFASVILFGLFVANRALDAQRWR